MKAHGLNIGVVMDPIARIHTATDTSFGLLLAAQARGCAPYYMTLKDLYLDNGNPRARMRPLLVKDRPTEWYTLGPSIDQPLDKLDVILMRKDPPVDDRYIYATHILESAERAGVVVLNSPRALRSLNEKLLATQFPHCMAPTLVSSSRKKIRAFIEKHKTVVVKPLGERAGNGIFKTHVSDPNLNSILDAMTKLGRLYIMVQQFLPALHKTGDKRIIMLYGEPMTYVLTRKPVGSDFRANMAAGGVAEGSILTDNDRRICTEIGETLRNEGIALAGIDIIGDYLTEINITSPTGVRALETIFKADISGKIWDEIVSRMP
jgi:glutathione synthase